MPFTIVLIKLLQWIYKRKTISMEYEMSNRNIAKIVFLKHLLYYYKQQFHAYGYYHISCTWSNKYDNFYKWLFPIINYKENYFAINHNPEAITYYHNQLYNKGIKGGYNYHADKIKKFLIDNKLNN